MILSFLTNRYIQKSQKYIPVKSIATFVRSLLITEFCRTWPVDATSPPASPFRAVNTGTPYYIRQEHCTSSVDTYWPRKVPELKSRCASAPSFHLLFDLPFRRLRTRVRDVTHVRVAEVHLILVRFAKKGDEKLLEILATRARSTYPFVLQTTLNKGGLILEWPPKKFSAPTHIHTQTNTYEYAYSRDALS